MVYISETVKTDMSNFGNPAYKEHEKPTFWKKNAQNVPGSIRPVYGAQHPPMQETPSSRQTTPKKQKPRDSFQEYENKTLDAWDDADDEFTSTLQMNMAAAQSTALAVLQKHKSSQDGASLTNREGNELKVTQSNIETSSRVPNPNHPSQIRGGPRFNAIHHPGHVIPVRKSNLPEREQSVNKYDKLQRLLAGPSIDLEQLKKACWSGISQTVRPMAWKILAGYLPANQERRELTLQRKRQEYFGFIDQYLHTKNEDLHKDTFRQIHIDIPRMNPLIPMFQQQVVQEIFERILFIWAIRHPASGYVQGMNDLVTPFFVVFLSEFLEHDIEQENVEIIKVISKDSLDTIEADSFWCMSKLLDGIQDNYTFAQPGIQLKVNALAELIKRIDAPLHNHLLKHSVEYLQFAFRWMNNLLMREIPLKCTIRLWDTYLCEPDGFASFHLYVCAAFLARFSKEILREKDFQGIMLTLQNLPTHHWKNEEISELLAEAFKLKYMFADAPKHLEQKK